MWKKVLRVATVSFALLVLCTSLVFAQERVVRGTVTDGAVDQPLPGVNVNVQGTQIGTTTDTEGRYEIEVPSSDAVLVFSFVGYRNQEVQVGDRDVVNVTLEQEVGRLEEVVVTGYGTQERREITGAISSVDVARANVGQVSSPQDLLQGRVSGVNIISNSGEPGADQRVRIRGRKSLSANADPLYVIDGAPVSNTNVTPSGAGGSSNSANPLSLINPQDIESIQVLKDAAATSIYGSQGSNGVILIETKSGTDGALQFDYSGQTSVGVPSRKLDVLSADQFRSARREFADAEITPAEEQTNVDWQDEAMRSTLSQEHNLSISGGTEQTSYRVGGNYLDQEGLLRNSGLRRTSGRANVSHTMLDNQLRVNARLYGSYMERNHIFRQETVGASGSIIKDMLVWPPTKPVRQDGEFFEFASQNPNPIGMLEQITDNTDQQRTIGNLSLEVDLLENLTAKGAFNADLSSGTRRSFIPERSIVGRADGGIASQAERKFSDLVVQSTLRYNRDNLVGGSLGLVGGFEYEQETFQQLTTETRDFVTDVINGFNVLQGGRNVQTPSSEKKKVEQLGFFGRLNYNIQDKYLLTATVRRDGSSVFGAENQWAWFPSASMGWNVAQEPFLDVDWLNQLKLRVSAGLSGNQGVPPLESQALLEASRSNSGVFGPDNEIIGVAQTRAARPDLKWEQTTEFNGGVDFTAGRFDGSIEYYTSTTEDLLLNVRVRQPAPSNFVLDNVGRVSNTGVEASLEALVLDRDDLSLTVSGTASSNRNKIEDLGGRGSIDHGTVGGRGLTGVTAQRLEPGHPIGSYYGPVFVGIDNDGQEVYENGEGGTTTDETAAVEKHIGNPIPDVTYSLNADVQYRNFDLSVFFRGEQGRQIYNNTALVLATKSRLAQGLNMLDEALDDGTTIDHSPTHSSRWVHDASFLRLEKLSVGYDLSRTMGGSGILGQIRRARIFASADNLFVLTPYDGFDPEMNANTSGEGLGFRTLTTPARGIDFTSFPRSRTFTVGLQFGL